MNAEFLRTVEVFDRGDGERRFGWTPIASYTVGTPRLALLKHYDDILHPDGFRAPIIVGNVLTAMRDEEKIEICARDEVTHVR